MLQCGRTALPNTGVENYKSNQIKVAEDGDLREIESDQAGSSSSQAISMESNSSTHSGN